MTIRSVTMCVALAAMGCDQPPPGSTATGDEKDKDPNEVAAVDVPGHRDDRDRRDQQRGRDRDESGLWIDPHAENGEEVEHLVAVVDGLGDRSGIEGVIHLRKKEPTGVEIESSVEGLPAGSHAYHVHLYGDCSSDDGESAGPHLNFHGPAHHEGMREGTAPIETTARPGVAQAPGASGVQPPPGTVDKTPATMIHGNLGDLVVTEGKPATAKGMVEGATWSDMLLGRSIVIHEKANDPTAGPDGGAGGRIACGVIGIAKGEDGDATAEGDMTPAAKPAEGTPTGSAPATPNPY
jgi:Cu-Zn family superoxide dismutase